MSGPSRTRLHSHMKGLTPMRFSLKAAVIGIPVLAVLVMLPTSAQASGIELPGRPSPSHQYGIAWASMPTTCDMPGDGEFGTTGGWSGRSFTVKGYHTNPPLAVHPSSVIRPFTARLSEVCRSGTGQPSVRVEMYATNAYVPDGYNWAPLSDSIGNRSYSAHTFLGVQPGIVEAADIRLTCATSQWSLPTQQTVRVSAFTYNAIRHVTQSGGTELSQVVSFPFGATAANCPYIVRMALPVPEPERNLLATGLVPSWIADTRVWSADHYASQSNPYIENVEREEVLCLALPLEERGLYAICEPYMTPTPDPDYASFDEMCADPPAAEWLDFSWIPAIIGHYSECLWIPEGGFDPDGLIAAEFEASGYEQVTTVIDNGVAAFSTSGGCGALPSVPILGSTFNLDTCTMSWAAPFRDLLGIGIAAGTGFYVLGVVVDVLVSLSSRKLKSPVAADS